MKSKVHGTGQTSPPNARAATAHHAKPQRQSCTVVRRLRVVLVLWHPGGGTRLSNTHTIPLPVLTPQAAVPCSQPFCPAYPRCLVLEHLPLADAIAGATARRLFPLVEREDLIQVDREALVRSAPRCRAVEPADPYLRRCIQGALQHHLRDRVRLVRVPRRLHEQGQCPLGHSSLNASTDGEPCLFDQLPLQKPSLPAEKPSMAWRWSSWLISCRLPRAQHSSSLCWRACRCELQDSSETDFDAFAAVSALRLNRLNCPV